MSYRSNVDKSGVVKLGCLIGLALVLRILQISRESLWLDEIASWTIANRDIAAVLRSEPTNPPLYYLALHFWIGWFGTSEAALRSLSVVPGVLATWLTFRFSTKLFDRNVGFLAAAYQAISTFHIYYSQEARCFAWLGTLVLAAALCLWNALHETSGRRQFAWFAAYSVLSAAAWYMHFIAAFFIGAEGLYVLARRRSHWLKAGASMAAAGLLFLPWFMTMLDVAGGGGQLRRYMLLKLPQAYFSFFFGDTLIPLDENAVQHIRQTLMANWWILLIGLAGTAVWLRNARPASRKWGEPFVYVSTLASLPVLLAYLVSLKVPFFDERYLFPASLFVYVVISAIFEEMRARAGAAASARPTYLLAAVSLGWCVLLLCSLYNYYFNPRFGREQWRETAAYLESRIAAPREAVVVFEPTYMVMCYRYYQKTPDLRVLVWDPKRIQAEARSGVRTIWLVRSHPESEDSLQGLGELFHQVGIREFPKAKGISVYEFSTSAP
jgi:uncharacterized membrane protein